MPSSKGRNYSKKIRLLMSQGLRWRKGQDKSPPHSRLRSRDRSRKAAKRRNPQRKKIRLPSPRSQSRFLLEFRKKSVKLMPCGAEAIAKVRWPFTDR
jgi:hypothetical protein